MPRFGQSLSCGPIDIAFHGTAPGRRQPPKCLVEFGAATNSLWSMNEPRPMRYLVWTLAHVIQPHQFRVTCASSAIPPARF